MSPRGKRYCFDPLTAVYYDLTGRKIPSGERGTIFNAFRRLGRKSALNWGTVVLFDNIASYPDFDHPHDHWDGILKKKLFKTIPTK
jgi:hypothetical protein